jgi:hypothetical protein
MVNGFHFVWAVYPILGMALGALIEAGALVGEDGVPLKSLFSGHLPDRTPNALPPSGAEDAVLNGPYGAILRQAMSDRRRIDELVAKLTEPERKMLPDVKGTADGLYGRVDSLAHALHQLEWKSDAAPTRLAELDARIAEVEARPGESTSRDRQLGLLRRQREMITELDSSRAKLLEQYESAGLLLQNLALDLLKVRSSGLDAALGGINNATQEARALSREIGYVLSAAEELKRVQGTG